MRHDMIRDMPCDCLQQLVRNVRFMGVAPDAGAWSPLPGGFNRWVERYHREILQHTRPVIITVHVRSIGDNGKYVGVVNGYPPFI